MLPDALDIVDTLAASLTFDPALTARDRSILFAVSWYAGQHPPVPGTDTMVPDLPLRRDLGDMRRPDAVKEVSRYRRLEHATMRTDETLPGMHEGALVPTVPSGMRRVTIRGERAWEVAPEIVSTFQPRPGDGIVGVPLSVLARARSRYTLPAALRLLAWGSGTYPVKWKRRGAAEHVVLRIPLDVMRAEIGADTTSASELLRSDIMPAIEEIRTLTELVVDIEPYRAPSIRKPQGRVLGFDVLVGKVAARVVPRPEPTQPPAEIVAFPSRRPAFAAFKPIPSLRKLGPATSPRPPDDDSPF